MMPALTNPVGEKHLYCSICGQEQPFDVLYHMSHWFSHDDMDEIKPRDGKLIFCLYCGRQVERSEIHSHIEANHKDLDEEYNRLYYAHSFSVISKIRSELCKIRIPGQLTLDMFDIWGEES